MGIQSAAPLLGSRLDDNLPIPFQAFLQKLRQRHFQRLVQKVIEYNFNAHA
jgi:hypothetical protein